MKALTDIKANIVEIFSSIQGEGLYIGERHLFIRFKDCNLNCTYCDEFQKTAQIISLSDTLQTIMIQNYAGLH